MTDNQSQPSISENTKHTLDQRPESPQRPSKIVRVNDEGEEQRQSIVSDSTMIQNPRNQRYLVAIEYIGTRFAGAQKQANGRTVVGVLELLDSGGCFRQCICCSLVEVPSMRVCLDEEAFQKFIGQPVSIFCSSRTDAGVHALSNVCHVDMERISKRKPNEMLPPHEPAVVKKAVNHFLQKNEGDIMVIDVRCVAADFHARYKAQERTYFYRLLSGPESLSTFEKERAWHVPEDLDLPAMQRACKVLVGCHDFSSFRAAACQAKSPIRNLEELNVTEVVSTPYFPSITEREQLNTGGEDPAACSESKTDLPHTNCGASQGFGTRRKHRCLVVTARARSFLYHQVRLLVGALKSVGTGDLSVPDVERILKARTVTAASAMAPANGLYLGHVKYDLP